MSDIDERQKTIDAINATTDIDALAKRLEGVHALQQVFEDACDKAPLALAFWGPQGFLALQGVPYAVYMEKAIAYRHRVREIVACAEQRLYTLRQEAEASAVKQ